jgi:hypothetical protein
MLSPTPRYEGHLRILSVVQSHSALLFRPGIVALGLGIGVGNGTGVAEGKASPDEEAADCLFPSGGVRPSGDAEATAAAPATRRRAELRMSESEKRDVEAKSRKKQESAADAVPSLRYIVRLRCSLAWLRQIGQP